MNLNLQNVDVHAGGAQLLSGVNLSVKAGELTALLGANGAGKTTVLRTALGFIQPESGRVTLGGDPVKILPPMERARRAAYLPQTRPLAWPNTVYDVIALGRFSHGANLGRIKGADAQAVSAAITACDIEHLAQRRTDTLSGGELARVHCARAFAARAPLLLADEPVAALDPRHQYNIMKLIRDYVSPKDGPQKGALVVLHDINLAARYADTLVWMKAGRIIASGAPQETLTSERLAQVYGVKARIEGLNVIIDGAL